MTAGGVGAPEINNALANLKQQIVQMQQEIVVSLASTSTVPPPPLQQPPPPMIPPPGTTGPPHHGQVAMQTVEELASSKLNQWKMPSSSSSSSEQQQQQQQMSGGDAPSGSQLDIEEFVPGKPWQGPSVRSVEDDPYITPGSVASRSSISSIDDAHVMNVLGGKAPIGPISKPVPGSGGAMSKTGSMVWSNDGGAPGLGQPTSSGHAMAAGLNRSVSWAAGERSASACE